MRFLSASLVAGLFFPAGLQAQDPARHRPADACDFSAVPGVVWWGAEQRMSMERLAAHVAPILWYSPDEPSLRGTEGVAIRIPEVMPGGGAAADRPVMYYQVEHVFTRPSASGEAVDRTPAGGPGSAMVDFAQVAALNLSFYAYFSWEEGLGAHPHDIEPVEFRLVVLPNGSKAVRNYTSGECGRPGWVVIAVRTSAKAHGLVWFWNVLETDDATRFPMHLLVEEGKHALATDKNGDGVFTKGYDVNLRINDAWGVRDIIRTGALYSGGFESWMAKTRRPEHRVFPPMPEDSPLRPRLEALAKGEAHAVYELRPFPGLADVGDDPNLTKLVDGKAVAGWPQVSGLNDAESLRQWVDEGAALKSLSIAYRTDGRQGFSFVFPFFVVRHLQDPMTGGYIMQRMYLKGPDLKDFGWMALYTPSASRWVDSYFAAGGENYRTYDSTGVEISKKWDFVMETGLKFRVNVEHTPVKFLAKLTPYWGLRTGIKGMGFFDVTRWSYVLEIGAGSF